MNNKQKIIIRILKSTCPLYNRAITPKRATADLAMAKFQEEQVALKELEENLTKKQSLLEKQKLDYDENIIKKEDLITSVSKIIIITSNILYSLLSIIYHLKKINYVFYIPEEFKYKKRIRLEHLVL